MKLSNKSSVRLDMRAKTDIVLDFAVKELSKYLVEIFQGIEFADVSANTIVLTNDTDDNMRFDGYNIVVKGDKLIISSSYSRGILYGVYDLLRLLGCDFAFPNKAYHVVPKHNDFILDDMCITKNPTIEYRGFCLYNTTKETISETLDMIDYMGKNNYNFLLTSLDRVDDTVDGNHAILWNDIKEDILIPLQKRGIIIDMSEHSTDFFFPREKHFNEHPEWFSLINGERQPLQICYSNMDAVKVYAESFCDYVRTNDNIDVIGIWPLDGGGYCQCEKCADKLTLLRANMYIASQIQKVRPELLVEHLAYTPQSFARPEEELPENMSVLVCHVNNHVAYEWGKKAKNAGGAFYFDYQTGDNYRYRANLWINPEYCRETTHTFASYGYRGIVSLYLPITAWWQASINYYYLSKGYYDPCYNKDAVTKDLIVSLFGEKNADVMNSIFIKITDELQDKFLWSRKPHKQEYMVETIVNRNNIADKLHQERFKEIYGEIADLFETVDISNFTPLQNTHFEYLKQYCELQYIYYFNIDQYDFNKDTEEKAIPYFEKLRELSNRYGNVFISENYAKWRIVGRDNILKAENVEGYQPQTD